MVVGAEQAVNARGSRNLGERRSFVSVNADFSYVVFEMRSFEREAIGHSMGGGGGGGEGRRRERARHSARARARTHPHTSSPPTSVSYLTLLLFRIGRQEHSTSQLRATSAAPTAGFTGRNLARFREEHSCYDCVGCAVWTT
ncbi:hypothetical protein PENSPDRAFT_359960 [Peniophora sp. CONT]|nr:hypothetical protein PENSPDRAFT_359960 [Peniophora sp. CONT]